MKKMVPWLITILLSITLIVLAAFLLMRPYTHPNYGNEPGASVKDVAVAPALSADQLVEVTSTIDGIKTNLSDPSYIVSMDFAFQLDRKTSKEAFDKIKDFKIKPLIIKTLADTKPEELNGAQGKDNLSSKVLNLINKSLPEGKVVQVEVTFFLVTQL